MTKNEFKKLLSKYEVKKIQYSGKTKTFYIWNFFYNAATQHYIKSLVSFNLDFKLKVTNLRRSLQYFKNKKKQ